MVVEDQLVGHPNQKVSQSENAHQVNESTEEKEIGEGLKAALFHDVGVFVDSETFKNSEEVINGGGDGFCGTDRLISVGREVADGEFVERVPEKFPEDAADEDDSEVDCDVADELRDGDVVVFDVEVGSGSGEGVRLFLVHPYYIDRI